MATHKGDVIHYFSWILRKVEVSSPAEMDLPGLQLHRLTGNRRGTWAVRVSGNWRLTFRFEDGEAVYVNLEDYH